MGARSRTVEEICDRLASVSHGVVTRRELLAAGLTRREIAARLARGGLIREYPGVYRVGHRAPSDEARYLAAVRACGDGAVLSGLAAAHLYGLVKRAAPCEVTAPTERSVPGVLTHRSRRAPLTDVASHRGIPVTSVARTLVDIAGRLSPAALARACHEAGVRYGTTPRQVEAVLARRPTAKGAPRLRRVLRGDEHVTLSRLERRFLDLLRANGLPLPRTNRPASGRRVDCRWPRHRLTVELDSYRYHRSRHAWEQDRRREREAHARGDEIRRYTWGDVTETPAPMLRELRSVLDRAP
jgi:very-short-patch-repair endonuclease